MAMEANFDGLIGPTHNYAGLSIGNIASEKNKGRVSRPREAALQGLAKMAYLAGLGLRQGLLPPHERPHLPTLRNLGFSGSDRRIVEQAAKEAPELLHNAYSASAMWTANAATVSPSADTGDGRVHFTPANLAAMLHRSIEPEFTGRILQAIFADEAHFAHHPAIPGGQHMGDEGAANHNRLATDYGNKGLEIFIYGRSADSNAKPEKFPARQALEASRAIVRSHGLNPAHTLFHQQNPAAIDAGAFHNDVVAVTNRNVVFAHEKAFLDAKALRASIDQQMPDLDLRWIEVPEADVPIGDAITSYIFNSQLLSPPNMRGMLLLLPTEAEETGSTRKYLETLTEREPAIERVEFINVRQSMRNGGGPACLRLRVVLSEEEAKAVTGRVFLDKALKDELDQWVRDHYREELAVDDLRDPALMDESFTALDELTGILGLGSLYDFQR